MRKFLAVLFALMALPAAAQTPPTDTIYMSGLSAASAASDTDTFFACQVPGGCGAGSNILRMTGTQLTTYLRGKFSATLPLSFNGSTGAFSLPLTSAHLLVGSAGGNATDVAAGGDLSLTNAGAFTVNLINGKTISLGGSFTTAGASALTLTTTALTNVTLPTSGTLLTNALPSGQLLVGSAGGAATPVAAGGDVTLASTGAFAIGANKVGNGQIVPMGANTMKANITAVTANPTDVALTTCADTGGQHWNYSPVTGITCGTSGGSSGITGVGVVGGESPVTVGDINSTIASGHFIVQTNATLTAARTWTLPSCATFGQHLFSFWDKANGITSTNTGTLARAGSDTIGNAGTTLTMATAGASVILECDGTSQWSVAGTVPPFTPVTNQFVTGISASGVWSSGAPTLVVPITYVPGINPNNIPIFRANASRTVTGIVCRPEVLAGGTATITVVKAASGTALSAGTALHSGSFNANTGAFTDQPLTVTVPSLASGDTVGIRTTGTTIWTSSGVATGVCTVYIQ